MASASNFLEVPMHVGPKPNLLRLMEGEYLDTSDLEEVDPAFRSIMPLRGFCVKSKTDNGEKIFINVCCSAEIPPPPATLDVRKLIAAGDLGEVLIGFPMSLGEPHIELDKAGRECKCYDVVINHDYFKREAFKAEIRDFIITLALSGLEKKQNISIDVAACVVMKKLYHGSMPIHYIEMNDGDDANDAVDVMMPVINPSIIAGPRVLKFKLFNITQAGIPAFLVFQGITRELDEKSLRILILKSELIIQSYSTKILSVPLPCNVLSELSLSNFSQGLLVVWMMKKQG